MLALRWFVGSTKVGENDGFAQAPSLIGAALSCEDVDDDRRHTPHSMIFALNLNESEVGTDGPYSEMDRI
jgi:hypothetical protein